MESIKRKLMLLKADANNKGRATLKLLSQNDGTAADLSTEELPDGIYALYLWDSNGKEYFAGNITGEHLAAKLRVPSLDKIAGAAVVDEPSGAFLLKTASYNWDSAAAAFRLSRIQNSNKTIVSDGDFDNDEHTKAKDFDDFREQQAVSGPKTEYDSSQPVCNGCPHVIRQDKINPFPSVFPQSEWVKISYPGPAGWWHYISGKILRGDKVIAKVLGVPGEYGMAPPIWLEGFGTYMRCTLPDAHGYWLMFQDAQTGEVLDMALSPRDE